TGRVVSVNQAMQTMLHRPLERMLEYRFTELVHTEERAELKALDVWAGGTERRPIEVRALRADGSALWCPRVGSPLRGPDRSPEGYVVIAGDISDRRTQL